MKSGCRELSLELGGGCNCTSRFGNLLKFLRACDLSSNGGEIHCGIAEVTLCKLVQRPLQSLSILSNMCIELFLLCVFLCTFCCVKVLPYKSCSTSSSCNGFFRIVTIF